MAAERIQNQTVTLLDGTKVTGKTIRRASDILFERLSAQIANSKTLGTAKVNGFEIAVQRGRGRNGPWYQVGVGRRNNA